jgi:hypothetical protein
MILSGHHWHAYSPSHFELASHPVQLVFNGHAWYLSFNGSYANAKPWPSRDAATAAIAQAFIDHQKQESHHV